MTKQFICITCPRSCNLTVTVDETTDTGTRAHTDLQERAPQAPMRITVSGNRCPKGADYGKQEAICPMRTLTTTVVCRLSHHGTGLPDVPAFVRLPVKTGCEIPLEHMFEAIKKVHGIAAVSPVRCGDCLGQVSLANGKTVPVIACAGTDD